MDKSVKGKTKTKKTKWRIRTMWKIEVEPEEKPTGALAMTQEQVQELLSGYAYMKYRINRAKDLIENFQVAKIEGYE